MLEFRELDDHIYDPQAPSDLAELTEWKRMMPNRRQLLGY